MLMDRGFIAFLKDSTWLQDIIITKICKSHPIIDHSIAKILALKQALWYAESEKIEGDYLEFGVFQGSSFISAFQAWRTIARGHDSLPRSFYGFDSFEGMKISNDNDNHPGLPEGRFSVDFKKVEKRIARQFREHAKWKLIKGYLENSIIGKEPWDLGIKKIAVALIDLDYMAPTKIALDFMKPALHEGSIILFDDYLMYRGSPNLGEQKAFSEFKYENPNFIFKRRFDYGGTGRAFIVTQT
jgi:hypothetical protein